MQQSSRKLPGIKTGLRKIPGCLCYVGCILAALRYGQSLLKEALHCGSAATLSSQGR